MSAWAWLPFTAQQFVQLLVAEAGTTVAGK